MRIRDWSSDVRSSDLPDGECVDDGQQRCNDKTAEVDIEQDAGADRNPPKHAMHPKALQQQVNAAEEQDTDHWIAINGLHVSVARMAECSMLHGAQLLAGFLDLLRPHVGRLRLRNALYRPTPPKNGRAHV